MPSIATAGPLVLPWIGHRRSATANAAAPLLTGALRRIVMMGRSGELHKDVAVLDEGPRVTLERLDNAASFNRMHPTRSYSFVYYLPHAGLISRAARLRPSRVHEVWHILNPYVRPERASDESLMEAARLAAVCDFPGSQMTVLMKECRWRVVHFLRWAEMGYDFDYFGRCANSEILPPELGDLILTDEVPTPDQLTLLEAFAVAPPIAAPA